MKDRDGLWIQLYSDPVDMFFRVSKGKANRDRLQSAFAINVLGGSWDSDEILLTPMSLIRW